jgi:hypothetical protein
MTLKKNENEQNKTAPYRTGDNFKLPQHACTANQQFVFHEGNP